MTAEQRRQEILTLLEQTDTPLSAAALAHRFSVSRQIVVGTWLCCAHRDARSLRRRAAM